DGGAGNGGGAAGEIAPDRAASFGAVQPGFVRGRLRGAIVARAVAVSALQHVDCGGRVVLLLRGAAGRRLAARIIVAGGANRTDQHDGIHAYSGQRVRGDGGDDADAASYAPVSAAQVRALLDGCAGAAIVRDGGGAARGASGGR